MTEQSEELQVAELLSPLSNRELPTEDSIAQEERKNRLVPQLKLTVRRPTLERRRRVRQIAGAASLLSAAAAFALWMNAPEVSDAPAPSAIALVPQALIVSGTDANVLHSSGVTQVRNAQPATYSRVERIDTHGEGSVRLQVPQGAPKAGLSIDVRSDSELFVTKHSDLDGLQEVKLLHGHLDIQVPKLSSNKTFSVITKSVRVSVVGTAFSVTTTPGQSNDTCVRVSEGLVRIEKLDSQRTQLALLSADQSWGCDIVEHLADPVATRQETGAPPQAAQVERQSATHKNGKATSRSVPTSTLAEETALLARAVRAEQQENHVGATRDLQRLLSAYPQSPLAGEARKLLRQIKASETGDKTHP